jgi:CYTH domain-containing protein
MAIEIERKFLVANSDYQRLGKAQFCRQGYLLSKPERTVRVRIMGEKGFFAVKGMTKGLSRSESEYEIPLADAKWLLEELCEKPLIEKKRYTVEIDGLTWHIDEFGGQNKGLVVAEVHLESEAQQIALPDWVGQEVSGDARYFNVNLARNPYCQWQ